MSNEFFKDVDKIDDLEKPVEFKSYTVDSGLYRAKINHAYMYASTKKDSNAKFVHISYTLSDSPDVSRSENICYAGKTGKVYYEREGKKFPLPGYALLNELTELTLGKKFGPNLTVEDKVVPVWDWDKKSEVNTEKPVLTELTDKIVNVAIQQELHNKFSNGKPTEQTTTRSIIVKFLDDEMKTLEEHQENKPATWKDRFLKRIESTPTVDKRTIIDTTPTKGDSASPFDSDIPWDTP